MTTQRVAGLVRKQAQACGRLGSPLYEVLLGHLADDVLAGGPGAAVLAGHGDDPADTALALRLAGAVHRLALAGEAPELARHYPSCGGDGDAQAAWPAFRAVLERRAHEVRRGLAQPPQTNEVGRAAALLGGVLAGAGPDPLPVRVWEIGASAGLNLRADLFRYVAQDGGSWGPQGSAVVLDPAWDRVPASAPAELRVVERVGADLAPVDLSTAEGEMRLASYVWPDQVARLDRLRAAIAVARRNPARLVTAGAAEVLRGLRLAEGALTVVWHSVMWQYVGEEERREVEARLAELGAAATSRDPLLHVAFEPGGSMFDGSYRFTVTTTCWPGGSRNVIGEAPPHGVPVRWTPASG